MTKSTHKRTPSNIGPWKQFRDLNIYVNPLGEVKYIKGRSEYLFKKWDFTGRGNRYPQKVIISNNKRYFVKRIIWESFYGPIPDGYAVVHKNGVWGIDELHNLKLEPIQSFCKRVCGTSKRRYVLDYTHMRKYKGATSAAKVLGVSRSTVIRYCNGDRMNPMFDLRWGGLVIGDDK